MVTVLVIFIVCLVGYALLILDNAEAEKQPESYNYHPFRRLSLWLTHPIFMWKFRHTLRKLDQILKEL